MSRVGKKPIPLPKGVKITIGNELLVEGPKGKLTVPIPEGIEARQTDGTLEFLRDSDQRAALHGLTRALAAAAVQGVSTGFTRELDIIGIGYRADVKGKIATFTLGYSHPIEVLSARWRRSEDRQADASGSQRLRQADGGTGGGQHPRAASARSVQEQGRPLHRRSAAQEGRQDRRRAGAK